LRAKPLDDVVEQRPTGNQPQRLVAAAHTARQSAG
jgi:hypothetical protein